MDTDKQHFWLKLLEKVFAFKRASSFKLKKSEWFNAKEDLSTDSTFNPY
jgi:hypothetical protein